MENDIVVRLCIFLGNRCLDGIACSSWRQLHALESCLPLSEEILVPDSLKLFSQPQCEHIKGQGVFRALEKTLSWLDSSKM